MMSRAEPGAERKRTKLNAPATATPAPRLPLTSRITSCTKKGSTVSAETIVPPSPLIFR